MKPSTTFLLAAVVGIIAFVAARQSAKPPPLEGAAARPTVGTPITARGGRDRGNKEKIIEVNADICRGPTVDEARRLSSRERMELLASGGQIYNGCNQIAFLTEVIGALTKEEMPRAAEILTGIQNRGNGITQQVWDSFWKQRGRVDPEECLKQFGPGSSFTNQADARNLMEGWLEVDAEAALAWAHGPKHSPMEAAAAARAITDASGGDLKQMRADIAALPAASTTTRQQCLQDYFDTALLSGEDQSTASVYGDLPASLQETAWPVALRRMTMEDPKTAADWMERNFSASAWNNSASFVLADRLANDDPAGTTRWLLSLPGAAASPDQSHQLVVFTAGKWFEKDPVAANQWLDSLPAESPWVRRLGTRFRTAGNDGGR